MHMKVRSLGCPGDKKWWERNTNIDGTLTDLGPFPVFSLLTSPVRSRNRFCDNTVQHKYTVNHICNLRFSSNHIFKG